MSSTPESATDGQPRENSSGDAGSRPAPNSPEAAAADAMNANSGSDASASDPTPSAIRTSLAQRFATARSTAGAPAGSDDTTAINSGAASELPTSPAGPEATNSGGGPAARAGAGATAAPAGAADGAAAGGATGAGSARTAQAPQASPRPTTAPAGAAAGALGPRRVRLALARIDPWSVMKLSFLLSIAVGIGIIVAAAAMWFVLDSMHVFADIRELLVTLDSDSFLTLLEYAEFDRVLSMAAIIAVIDVFLLTALGTLGAFLYNIVAALVGGLHVTFTDE
ncbi:MAG TPA: DUF3566 domain-containing protein [Actinomycetaceae bacterium]|nr:DUF3566 domain-containing protein [Actinomycetaceae bacterium]